MAVELEEYVVGDRPIKKVGNSNILGLKMGENHLRLCRYVIKHYCVMMGSGTISQVRVWVPKKKSDFLRVLGDFGFPTTSLLMDSGSKSRAPRVPFLGFGYQKSRVPLPRFRVFGYPNPSLVLCQSSYQASK